MTGRAGDASAPPIEDELGRTVLVLQHPPRTHRLWTQAKRWLGVALALAGAGLLAAHLGSVDWASTLAALRGRADATLWGAAALTLASYAVYSSFDLLARRHFRQGLGRLRVLEAAFVSHAFALNLGPIGVGFRFRAYMHSGMPARTVAAVWVLNLMTNWLGFMGVAGALFAAGGVALPASWGYAGGALRLFGLALLAAAALYVAACAAAHGRALAWRGRRFALPSWRLALLQLALSALNWSLLAGVWFLLFDAQVPVADVLAAVVVNALVLALVDVPGGLGITETVFVALLGWRLPAHELMAGLVAWRGLYLLAPLALAGLAFAQIQGRAHSSSGR